jgi:multidrug transporter EmrE-like cation transporter
MTAPLRAAAWCLSKVLRSIPADITYAVWSG